MSIRQSPTPILESWRGPDITRTPQEQCKNQPGGWQDGLPSWTAHLCKPIHEEVSDLADKRKIAHALGKNLARMQAVTWPITGRFNPATERVDPFDLAFELAHPFPVASDARLADIPPTAISYSERVKACLRYHLLQDQEYNALTTTPLDISWVEEHLADAQDALNDTFEPCLLMDDYKEGNLVVEQQGERWQVSGVFDLMEAHFGDGEADLARQFAEYYIEDESLAQTFLDAYRTNKPLRPGFVKRFPIYLLLDRAIIWFYFQRQGQYLLLDKSHRSVYSHREIAKRR